uniref:Uncharacterized protein n=1 Tax=Arundo donax TaxID=35708 RepID=A0A0A9B2J7_ARUDO
MFPRTCGISGKLIFCLFMLTYFNHFIYLMLSFIGS